MANKSFTPAQLASNIAFQSAKKTTPIMSTTPAPLQSLLKPKTQQPQAPSTNVNPMSSVGVIPGAGLPQVNQTIKSATDQIAPVNTVIPKELPKSGASTLGTLSSSEESFARSAIKKGFSKQQIESKILELRKPSTTTNLGGGVVQSIASAVKGVGDAVGFVGKYDPTAKLAKRGIDALANSNDKVKTIVNLAEQAKNKTNDFLSNAGEKITGADPKSTAFKVGKIGGDIAQFFIPAGKAGLVEKGAVKAEGLLAKVLPKTEQLATEAVVGGGNKVVNRAPNLIEKIALDKKTLKALETTTPKELDTYIRATEEAVGDISKPTAYEFAAKKTDQAVSTIKKQMQGVGKQIGEIRSSVEDFGTRVEGLLNKFNTSIQKFGGLEIKPNLKKIDTGIIGPDGNMMTKEVQQGYKLIAPKGVAKITDSEVKVVNDFLDDINAVSKNPQIGGLLNTKQKLTNAFDALEKKSPQLGAIKDSFVSGIDKLINDVTPEQYKPLLQQYSKYLKVMKSIERLYGKEGERGSTMIRNMFGSNSARTRELFNKIKELSGVDLYKEGQLAKFVMESMGETRGLQNMMESVAGGFPSRVATAVKYGKDKLFDPIDAAKRIVNSKKQQAEAVANGVSKMIMPKK